MTVPRVWRNRHNMLEQHYTKQTEHTVHPYRYSQFDALTHTQTLNEKVNGSRHLHQIHRRIIKVASNIILTHSVVLKFANSASYSNHKRRALLHLVYNETGGSVSHREAKRQEIFICFLIENKSAIIMDMRILIVVCVFKVCALLCCLYLLMDI